MLQYQRVKEHTSASFALYTHKTTKRYFSAMETPKGTCFSIILHIRCYCKQPSAKGKLMRSHHSINFAHIHTYIILNYIIAFPLLRPSLLCGYENASSISVSWKISYRTRHNQMASPLCGFVCV